MIKTPDVQKTLALVIVELFFAVLPILVLGTAAAASGKAEEIHHFWVGPEWPMTSSILYGLTISRYLQGFLRVIQTQKLTQLLNERILLLILIPTGGLILSGVFISASLAGPNVWLQVVNYFNIAIAICVFVVLGGYGIKNAE